MNSDRSKGVARIALLAVVATAVAAIATVAGWLVLTYVTLD